MKTIKNVYVIILLFFFICNVNAQESNLESFLSENGKFGLKNKNNEIIVKPIYDAIWDFSEGIAKFKKDGLFGYFDINGKVIVKPKYTSAFDFNEGIAIVGNTIMESEYLLTIGNVEHWNVKTKIEIGAIDKTGRLVIPLKYILVEKIGENLFLVAKWNFTDKTNTGKPIIKYGLYNTLTKKEQLKSQYTYFDMKTFLEKGWIVVSTSKFTMGWVNYYKNSFGIINYSGKVIIPVKYEIFDVGVFSQNERILVGEVTKRNISMFAGKTGDEIKEAKYGIIDYSGKIIIPLVICERIELLSNNTYVIIFENGSKKYYDLNGLEIK